MADEPQDTNEEREPTPEEIEASRQWAFALLKKRGIDTLTCPVCGSTDWGPFGSTGLVILANRNPESGEAEAHGSVHTLSGACSRCGFIVQFDRGVLGG